MTIAPESLETFLDIFREAEPRIRASDGCLHLELWQDLRYPSVVTTYSRWQSEAHLEAYRQSPFFRETWEKTRQLFAAPPFAASHFPIG